MRILRGRKRLEKIKLNQAILFSFSNRVVMMNRERVNGAKMEVQTDGMKEYYVTFRDKFYKPYLPSHDGF